MWYFMILLLDKVSFATIKNGTNKKVPIFIRSKLETADERNGAEMPCLSQI